MTARRMLVIGLVAGGAFAAGAAALSRIDETHLSDVLSELRRIPPGGTALLLVVRQGEQVFLPMTTTKEP